MNRLRSNPTLLADLNKRIAINITNSKFQCKCDVPYPIDFLGTCKCGEKMATRYSHEIQEALNLVEAVCGFKNFRLVYHNTPARLGWSARVGREQYMFYGWADEPALAVCAAVCRAFDQPLPFS